MQTNEADEIRQELAPVLDWFQSDDHPSRPTVDIVRELVEEAQNDRSENLRFRAVMKPFNKMAGELFARNYDADDRVLMFRTPDGETVELTFVDFLCVRDALNQPAE